MIKAMWSVSRTLSQGQHNERLLARIVLPERSDHPLDAGAVILGTVGIVVYLTRVVSMHF
jgi:hypothetical protein